MEIRDLINIIWRRKFTLLITLIATEIIVIVGTMQIVPVYQASTTLRVAVSASGSLNYSDYMYADRLMNTYVNITTSGPVVQEIVDRLSLSKPPEIEAEIIPSTELIKISVEDTNPSRAAAIANTLADVLIEQNSKLFIGGGKSLTDVLGQQLTVIQKDLEETRQEYENLLARTPPAPDNINSAEQLLQLKQNNYSSLLAQYEQAKFREDIQASMITVFERATTPIKPASPRVSLNIILGFIAGLVGGMGLAFLFENLDRTLYEIGEIEAITKLCAFAKIPKADREQLTNYQEKESPLSEAFRNLATSIRVTDHHQSKRVLLLISAEPNQGKSIITYHLACSLAELGNEIVTVDCDTRSPKLHSFFHLSNQTGLTDILEQRDGLENALQKSSFEGVKVITSGSQLAHPTQMLSSIQMTKLVKSLKQEFDYVLLDSPAMLAVADVSALIPIADVLILVVRQGHAQKESVQAISNFVAGQNNKLTLLIINQVDNTSHYYYYKEKKPAGSLFSPISWFQKKVNRLS